VIVLARPGEMAGRCHGQESGFMWYITKVAPIVEDESTISLSSDERNLLAVTPLNF